MEETLKVLTLPAGMFFGIKRDETATRVAVSHLVSLAEPTKGTFTMSPEPMPLDLVGDSVGEDMLTWFDRGNLVMESELSLPLQEASSHPIVERFKAFWGLGNASADGAF